MMQMNSLKKIKLSLYFLSRCNVRSDDAQLQITEDKLDTKFPRLPSSNISKGNLEMS
ncbi:hypothetical protein DPMN_166203 [Dreissena polymorpha]|uniref:Uncharacterized protein n=1 Tax=Dreissena polymorpha TaxID=45954 RepID=A0A9D4IXP0_DREPO|nr:hypothetical protein DPMN_166203 [Dreissena polymorpha]